MKQANNERLARLEDLRAGQAEQLLRADTERAELRVSGSDPSKLRELTALTAGMRQAYASLLLQISRAHRDEGDHAGAVEHAKNYAHQEHVAKTMLEGLARSSS